MSAALAIAATSEILRFLVEDGLKRVEAAFHFVPASVTIGAPPAAADSQSINLSLCQAVPNTALRNAPGFVHVASGEKTSQPPLLLDLVYLASAHGTGIAREAGLGAVIEAFRETPSLSPAIIRAALTALDADGDPLRRALSEDAVIDGFESVTIKPQTLGIDSSAGLWIAAQAPFSPSAVYVVTIAFQPSD